MAMRLWQGDQGTYPLEFSTSAYGAHLNWDLDTISVITGTCTGTSMSLRINDGTAVSGSVNAYTPDGLSLGSGYDQDNYSNITVRELIIRNGVDSQTNRDSVYVYLDTKYINMPEEPVSGADTIFFSTNRASVDMKATPSSGMSGDGITWYWADATTTTGYLGQKIIWDCCK